MTMPARHLARRDDAVTVRIASKVMSGERRLGVMDAAFNLREAAKQLILVEDHLYHPHKFCPDCIRKHLLTVEALAEEAVTLGQTPFWQDLSDNLAEKARVWLIQITDGNVPRKDIAAQIRSARKSLVSLVYDPRDMESRVVSFHEVRSQWCPHRS